MSAYSNRERAFMHIKKVHLLVITLAFVITLLNVSPNSMHDFANGYSQSNTASSSLPHVQLAPRQGNIPAVTPAGAPVAFNDSYSINEDTSLIVSAPGVLANDSDENNDVLTAVLDTSPSEGSLSLSSDGSFSYVPDEDFFGEITFTYHASNGVLSSDPATVTITVNPVNDPPVSADDAYSTNEDTPLFIAAPGVLTNDYDVDSPSQLTAYLVTPPDHGSIVLFLNGSFEYTPDANWNGVGHFQYHAFDTIDYGNIATVLITVYPVDDPPVAQDDEFTIKENTALVIHVSDLLSNDYDVDGDPLSFSLVSYPAFGTLQSIADGEYLYTPNQGYWGSDYFTYRVLGGAEYSLAATVKITVVPEDVTPPTTTISLSGDLGENGWYTSAVTITLNAIDDTSSQVTTFYSLDNLTWVEYTGPFHLTSEGASKVFFYSVDEYGNAEKIKSQDIRIDTTPPDIEFAFDNGYLTITISDATSGVFQYSFSVSGIGWILSNSADGLGEHVISLDIIVPFDGSIDVQTDAVDGAGLMSQAVSSFWFDITPPDTTISYSGTISKSGWFVSSVVVTLTATDALSATSTVYSLDGKNWITYTGPFTISNDGMTTIYYYSTDTAGNVEATKSSSVIVDTDVTGPIITILHMGGYTDADPGYWTVTAVDPESGIGSITIEIDGLLVGTTQGDYAVPNSLGVHTIRVNATNADVTNGVADQDSSTLSETVTITDDDITGPLITIVYTGGATISDPGQWTVTVDDPESGIASILVEIDGETVGTAAGEFMVPAIAGAHNITVTAYNADLDRGAIDQEMSTASASVTVSGESTPGTVTGGGWIVDANGNKAHFAFVVKLKPNGAIRGAFLYTFIDGNWLYVVTSTEFTQLVIDGNHAYFEAKCDIVRLSYHKCKSYRVDGTFTVRVDVWDNHGRHAKDIFQIRIFDSSGQVWHEAGFNPMGYVHGAVVIHEYRRLKTCYCHHWR
jgi:VCBS repeat-containing protein